MSVSAFRAASGTSSELAAALNVAEHQHDAESLRHGARRGPRRDGGGGVGGRISGRLARSGLDVPLSVCGVCCAVTPALLAAMPTKTTARQERWFRHDQVLSLIANSRHRLLKPKVSSKIQMMRVPPGVENCSCRRSPPPCAVDHREIGGGRHGARGASDARCPAIVPSDEEETRPPRARTADARAVRRALFGNGREHRSPHSLGRIRPELRVFASGSASRNNLVRSVMSAMAIPEVLPCATFFLPRRLPAPVGRSTGASGRSRPPRRAAARSPESSRLRSHRAR